MASDVSDSKRLEVSNEAYPWLLIITKILEYKELSPGATNDGLAGIFLGGKGEFCPPLKSFWPPKLGFNNELALSQQLHLTVS